MGVRPPAQALSCMGVADPVIAQVRQHKVSAPMSNAQADMSTLPVQSFK